MITALIVARQGSRVWNYTQLLLPSSSISTTGHCVDDRIDFVNQLAYHGFSLRFAKISVSYARTRHYFSTDNGVDL